MLGINFFFTNVYALTKKYHILVINESFFTWSLLRVDLPSISPVNRGVKTQPWTW